MIWGNFFCEQINNTNRISTYSQKYLLTNYLLIIKGKRVNSMVENPGRHYLNQAIEVKILSNGSN